MANLNSWWVTGITDGEGCFSAGVSFRVDTGRNGPFPKVDVNPKFSLALRADDEGVVEALRDFFGCGAVYDKAPSPALVARGGVRGGTKPQKLLLICKLDDLIERVVPHFETHPLQSKKHRDFETWKEILLYVREHLSGTKGWARRFPDKIAHLQQLCNGLAQGRGFDVQGMH